MSQVVHFQQGGCLYKPTSNIQWTPEHSWTFDRPQKKQTSQLLAVVLVTNHFLIFITYYFLMHTTTVVFAITGLWQVATYYKHIIIYTSLLSTDLSDIALSPRISSIASIFSLFCHCALSLSSPASSTISKSPSNSSLIHLPRTK